MTRLGLALLGGGLLLAGCGAKGPENTPEAVAQAFAEAMAGGDGQAAAELWDYVAQARKDNSDWDEIASGQRQQIITKMTSDKASELAAQASLFGAGMTAGTANTSGTTASVPLQGGPQGNVTVYLTQSDRQWGVTGFAAGG